MDDDLGDLGDLGDLRSSARARPSVDDALDELKRRAASGQGPGTKPKPGAKPSSQSSGRKPGTVDDELAALKRKMAAAPPKKK